MNVEAAVALAAAIIAAASAGVSVYYSHRSHVLTEESIQDNYLERMRDWADETIDIVVGLSRLYHCDCTPEEFQRERGPLRVRLSAQIEKGRWFFPNVLRDRIGERKERAYRGRRQPILDHLVEIHDAVELDWDHRVAVQTTLRAEQRGFVSEVQQRIDPSRRDRTYCEVVATYRERRPYVEEEPAAAAAAGD